MKTDWPELSYNTSKNTFETLHLWTQIVGKIKLKKQTWVNHSWHVTLRITPTGLSTADLYDKNQHFQIDFDLVHHTLNIVSSTGKSRSFVLANMSVADFYHKLFGALEELGISVSIYKIPNELENPIPFDQDHVHKTYDREEAGKLHQALLKSQETFQEFRAGFQGKCSPVQFFWGGFDLAVSRFSGRTASKHPGGMPNLPDWVVQEAYSHEVCSCGFWPGSEALPEPIFYSYIYPEPEGYRIAKIKPAEAYFHETLGEFILPYKAVRKADNPKSILLDFLQSTYEAAAIQAKWDRKALEFKV